MLQLKKGDKVTYLGEAPYILSNGQRVDNRGDVIMIKSDVKVQKRFFK